MYVDPYCYSATAFWLMTVGGIGLSAGLAFALVKLTHTYDEAFMLRRHRAKLQGVCSAARATFRRYEMIHKAKNTPEGDKKAHDNAVLADMLDAVLLETNYQELGPMQQAFEAMQRRLNDGQTHG